MREEAGAARYSLLEPVRQYAAGRLRESGAEAAVRDRHASHFVRWAVAAEPLIYSGGSDPARFTALDAQLSNLHAAAEWLATRADGAEAGLRLATALEWYWFIRGRSREGRQWLQTALAHAGPVSALTRARALSALAMQAFCHADVALLRSAAGEAVALLRGLDAPVPLAYALTLLGSAVAMLDDVEGAQALLHEAVALSRPHDARVLVTVLTFAGFVARVRDDPSAAQRAWEEALGLARVLRMPYAALHLTAGLGRLASAQGDAVRARARFGEALASHVAADDLWGLALILGGQAAVAILEDQPATAARLLGAARAVRDGIGVPPGPDEAPLHERIAAQARAALGEARFDEESRAGAALGPDDALALARTVGTGPSAAVPASQPGDGASVAGPPDGGPGPARPALRVVTLGSIAIHRDGVLLPPGAFAYARPRDLLLYLLCFPAGRTRSQIGLAFWPDASPAQLKNNFHVTLHHLRRAVGGDVVVAERERYGINPALDVDFDASAFERDVRAALAALKGGAPPAAASRLREALDRYGGDFLEGESVGDWHLEVRERLRRVWEDGMLALAASLAGAGMHAEAAAAYERVVQREALHEGAYRGLMTCLVRAGDRNRALRAYDRLAALLRTELEAEPERETVALHARIRSAAPV
jgi:DNA-binding SARP family transcriptional activator